MNKRYLLILGVLVLAALLISACGPKATPTPRSQAFAENEGNGGEGEAGEAGEGGEGEEEGESEPVNNGVPEDIPVPENAFNIRVTSNGENIEIEVDGEIEPLLEFYQEELPNYGWTIMGPPDNSVGAMATMYRENEAGETLTINMQYNQNGNFVSYQIIVIREGVTE
jgi:hypothetical protein